MAPHVVAIELDDEKKYAGGVWEDWAYHVGVDQHHRSRDFTHHGGGGVSLLLTFVTTQMSQRLRVWM